MEEDNRQRDDEDKQRRRHYFFSIPSCMGFKPVSNRGRKGMRNRWVKSGKDWEISIPIPMWQSRLFDIMPSAATMSGSTGIDYPVKALVTWGGKSFHYNISSPDAMQELLTTIDDPMTILAASNTTARKLMSIINDRRAETEGADT